MSIYALSLLDGIRLSFVELIVEISQKSEEPASEMLS
tara:strand:- start:6435 stop:6545 length:111 start_codon:yes stop_codon:yes gene_type:complete